MCTATFQRDNGNNLVVPIVISTKSNALSLVIASWDKGLDLLNDIDNKFLQYTVLDDQLTKVLDQDDTSVAAWANAIPDQVLKSARNLPRLYTSLLYAAASNYAAQLLCSAPVLYSLLVDHAIKNHWSQAFFAKLVTHKRADQLQLVMGNGLQTPKSALKFLNRFNHQPLVTIDLNDIKGMLRNGDYRKYSHYQNISVALLRLIKKYPFVQKSKWIYQLQSSQQCMEVSDIIDDIIYMSSNLHIKDYSILNVISADSVDALDDLVDTLNKVVNMKSDLADRTPFPPPPVSGDDFIQPVDSSVSLFKVGVSQKNCVFDYLQDIRNGSYYIYQVKGKDLVTLGVHIKYDGIVLVDQLLAASNRPVSDDMHQKVKRWLQKSLVSRKLVLNNYFSVDYKAKQQNKIMSDYLAYSRPRKVQVIGMKYVADFKDKQNDHIMSDYADYCALG